MFAQNHTLKPNHANVYRADEHVSQAIRPADFSCNGKLLTMIQARSRRQDAGGSRR